MAGMSQGFSPAADRPPAAGCAKLAAEYDWSKSEFGPPDNWDPAVAAVVRTLIEATAPIAYCHGQNHAMIYNDRFADLLGARHPRAWGQRADLVMPEIWSRPGYAEAVDHVFAGGPSFHDDGEMVDLDGQQQSDHAWAYLARSYSPVRDNQGAVLGILVVVVEIAPVLVLVGDGEHGDQGAARWRGVELWDETVARPPLIWSGFRAGARAPTTAATETDQQFIAEGLGQRVLPINRPDIARPVGSPGVQRHLPDVQMVTLAGRGRNDTAGAATSGEFYDVIDLPDGRVALTIGDVLGAGDASAAVMAQVTLGVRQAVLTSSDPTVILAALDDLVSDLDRTGPAAEGLDRGTAKDDSAGFGGELLVTALIGIFDPATGELLLASAGHNPPAVVHRAMPTGSPPAPDSQPSADYAGVEPGPPLGITGARPVNTVLLGDGDALVAFTHGLLKRHEQSLVQRQAALLQALSMMSATAPRSISQYLVDTLIGDQGLEHDCAMLVVVHGKGVHQMTSVLIPPHTIAVRGARRWARAQLESWGLNEEVVIDTVMSVSELVSNVVQHAGTSARVTMELADRLLVMVEDTGSWSSPRSGPEDHTAVNGRGLALEEAVSDAMGYARGAVGSTVWFEIEPDREGAKLRSSP